MSNWSYNQLSLFETDEEEYSPGQYIQSHGAVICGIMRRGYIGKMVAYDCSTESHRWTRVGILEDVIPTHYYHNDQRIECDRSVIYIGQKQRILLDHWPGRNIFEIKPWTEYKKRMEAIGGHK